MPGSTRWLPPIRASVTSKTCPDEDGLWASSDRISGRLYASTAQRLRPESMGHHREGITSSKCRFRQKREGASSADHRFCGPRPFLLLGAHTGVLVVARPSPIFVAADHPGLDRVKVDVLDLLVVCLDGAQGAVEEPGLPQFSFLTPEPVDRVLGRGEAAPRPYFMASKIMVGCTGAQMRCPSADGSGRKTQAFR